MERYIALLRGVNVGGHNKIPMPHLRAALEKDGLSEVSTYINSGNLLFCCDGISTTQLQAQCRRVIQTEFGLDIAVAVLSAKDYVQALCHAPAWWGSEPDYKNNVIVVIAPAGAADLVGEVGAREEYEKVAYHGQVIFWSAPLKTFSRTRWSKVVTSSAYGSITVRNANTARKLLQLAEQQREKLPEANNRR